MKTTPIAAALQLGFASNAFTDPSDLSGLRAAASASRPS